MKTKHTFQVNFFPRKIKKKPASAWVYARITVNGGKVEFSLKRKVEIACWDSNRGMVRAKAIGARQLNIHMDQVRTNLYEAYDELRREHELITAETLKARYFGEDEQHHTLVELWKQYRSYLGIRRL